MGTNKFRAQSAMEYLMTYGWAILIIAIVLAAMFTLGIFKSPVGTTCRSFPGYVCTAPVFTGTLSAGGNLIASVGQGTGATWYDVGYVYVPSSASTSTPTAAALGSASGTGEDWVDVANVLNTGSTVTATLPVPVGAASGTIWAEYATTSGGTPSVVLQVAKATVS